MPDKDSVITTDLTTQMKAEKLQREALREYVSSELIEGTDWGKISIRGTVSKPTLYKPGMEKILSLFRLKARMFKDEDTLSMINKPGVICYRCELYKQTRDGDEIWGEGRGACSLQEKPSENTAIKIAEKRAKMDATLSLGFSEYFTQDLDDMPTEEASEQPLNAVSKRFGPTNSNTNDGSFAPSEPETLDIAVEDTFVGQSKTGHAYKALSTEYGRIMAWQNTESEFEIGGIYRVRVIDKGRGKEVLELLDSFNG